MFVLRAAFWFSVVALFMLHEPDAKTVDASEQSSGAMISSMQTIALANLKRVKTDLQARHAREL